jgi:hypothetical protein
MADIFPLGIVSGGAYGLHSLDATLTPSGIVSGEEFGDLVYGIFLDISFSWQTQTTLVVDKAFEWHTGQQQLLWYRIQGCCNQTSPPSGSNPGGCVNVGFQTDDTTCTNKKQQFVQNIQASGLVDLCNKLNTILLSKWTLCTVQQYNIPSVVTSNSCVTLTTIPLTQIPECVEFNIQENTIVSMTMEVKAQVVHLYTGSGGVTFSGQATTSTTGTHGYSYYEYAPDGGSLSLSGSADTSCSWDGNPTISMKMGVTLDYEQIVYNVVENAPPIAPVTGTVSTNCGLCQGLPLILSQTHNLPSTGIFSDFLQRNGFTMPTTQLMHWSNRLKAWTANYHLVGVGNNNDSSFEKWAFTFNWSCVNQVGGVDLGGNYWKYSMLVVRSNSVAIVDADTRLVVVFPSEQMCSGFQFDFSFVLNTTAETIVDNLDIITHDIILTDNIGLFKSQTWIANPLLRIELSETTPVATVQYQSIDSIIPQPAVTVGV